MKSVALLISITDDWHGFLLVESVVFRGVSWKYREGISGLAGAWYGNHLHPIVCALRNSTFGLIPVLGSKCLWSPKPDSVASQVTSALGGVSRRRMAWGSIRLPQLVQTVWHLLSQQYLHTVGLCQMELSFYFCGFEKILFIWDKESEKEHEQDEG